jgi:hypothetical protein
VHREEAPPPAAASPAPVALEPVPEAEPSSSAVALACAEEYAAEVPPDPDDGVPRKVIIVADAMPGREQVQALVQFLDSVPGRNTVELRLPDGVVPFARTCGLKPSHEPRVGMILGSAMVHYDIDSVDTDALSRGLDL